MEEYYSKRIEKLLESIKPNLVFFSSDELKVFEEFLQWFERIKYL